MRGADDERGSTRGLVASLHPLTDGRAQLRFDDARLESAANPPHWTAVHLFTSTDIDRAELTEMRVSEEKLADIGLSVLARLAAVTGFGSA